MPDEREDQPPGQLGGRDTRGLGPAHGDASPPRSIEVDRSVPHPRGDEEPEVRQPLEELCRERRPLAHRADDLVRVELPCRVVDIAERLVEEHDLMTLEP